MKLICVLKEQTQFSFLPKEVQNNVTTDKLLCFRSGNLACVRALLQANPKSLHSVEYRLRTALHFAAYEGHLHLVKFLLDNGANPDQR